MVLIRSKGAWSLKNLSIYHELHSRPISPIVRQYHMISETTSKGLEFTIPWSFLKIVTSSEYAQLMVNLGKFDCKNPKNCVHCGTVLNSMLR